MRILNTISGFLFLATSTSAATLYLAGDSTMALNNGGVIQGWGTQVGKYLNIAVVNDAVGGTSSRTFTTSGDFANMAKVVKSGDIVVIEFGHNDGGGATAGGSGVCGTTGVTTTCSVGGETVFTFEKYIDDAVNSFKAKGAKVIVSSQTPDNPFVVGTAPSRFVGYAQTAAANTGVSYINHFNFVLREFEALGNTTVSGFYPIDHLHTNAAGADIVAQTFVRGVLCVGSSNPLFPFVTNKNVVPTSSYLLVR